MHGNLVTAILSARYFERTLNWPHDVLSALLHFKRIQLVRTLMSLMYWNQKLFSIKDWQQILIVFFEGRRYENCFVCSPDWLVANFFVDFACHAISGELTFDKVVRKEANKKMFYDWQKTLVLYSFCHNWNGVKETVRTSHSVLNCWILWHFEF